MQDDKVSGKIKNGQQRKKVEKEMVEELEEEEEEEEEVVGQEADIVYENGKSQIT